MRDFNSINPYIRLAMNSVLPENYVIKQRIIYDYELIYIQKGELIFNYGGVDYNCRQGQFILIRPCVQHTFITLSEKLYQPHIHFDMIYNMNSKKTPVNFKDLPELTQEEKGLISKDIFENYPQYPFVTFSDTNRALSLFFEIVNAPNNAQGLLYKARLSEIISMLISDNFPDVFSASSEGYKFVSQIKDYIDAAQGLSMSLEDFERQFSYSKFYIERQFKKHYGISLIEYRNTKRMQRACELLRENTVTKVSDILGFSSVYSFSRTFKAHFGKSPQKFKKSTEQK